MMADDDSITSARAGNSATKTCPVCQMTVSAELARCPNDGALLHDMKASGQKGLAERYEILSVLATGGMGVIYLARHVVLNQRVAIKMLQTEQMDENNFRRFKREAETLSTLEHPNIVHLRDYGTSSHGQPYMVLDYIDGRSLTQIINQEGPLQVDTALEIFIQLTDALGQAHDKGILHRDLKPGNIMITIEGARNLPHAQIIDFGIARVGSEQTMQQLTGTGEILGSPAYMSPEQALGNVLDARTDIYSLGCVLFESLTGVPPFEGATAVDVISKHLKDLPPKLSERSKHSFSKDLESIVDQCLQKDPKDRIQTMQEFRDKLATVDTKAAIKPETKTEAKKSIRQLATLMLTACVALFVLTVGMFLTFLFLENQHQQEREAEERANMQAQKLANESVTRVDTGAIKLFADRIRALKTQPQFSHNAPKFVGNEPISDDSLKEFSQGPPCIGFIDMQQTQIKGPGLAYLIREPLIALALNETNLRDRGLREIRRMTYLKELEMDNTEITNNGLALLKDMKLHRLSVRDDDLDDESMKIISNIDTLEHLEIGRNKNITSKGYAELKKLKHLAEIDTLADKLDTASARAIGEIPIIQGVFLCDTDLDDNGLKEICKAKNLVRADLSNDTKLTPKGLLQLTTLPLLRIINCEGITHLHDDDFKFLGKFANLNDLNIDYTATTDKVLDYIPAKNIELLHIAFTGITPDGLMKIAKFPHLRQLIVGKGQYTNYALSDFKIARPDVSIVVALRHSQPMGLVRDFQTTITKPSK